MKVTINERDYELKEISREEAKTYIQKEVYVWDMAEEYPVRRKLLEVFQTDCDYPFCVLRANGTGATNFACCAPVPEEWYVQQLPDGTYESICPDAPRLNTIDHGSKEYCEQKAKELNEQKETEEPSEQKESTEHRLTNYEFSQLLKCFGVEWKYFSGRTLYTFYSCYIETEKPCVDDIIIRYKCGKWMPATRETVWKWWGEEVPNSDIARFVSFIGWDENKDKE